MSTKVEEMEAVITAMRTGSDYQASAVLARLRLGDELGDIVKELPQILMSAGTSGHPRYASSSFVICAAPLTISRQLGHTRERRHVRKWNEHRFNAHKR